MNEKKLNNFAYIDVISEQFSLVFNNIVFFFFFQNLINNPVLYFWILFRVQDDLEIGDLFRNSENNDVIRNYYIML